MLQKPMLAASVEPSQLSGYPYLAQPKLDGIRCLTYNGVAYSRSLKPIPNKYVQLLAKTWPDGLDGELSINDNIQLTTSVVMSHDKPLPPTFSYNVFDVYNSETPAADRSNLLKTFCHTLLSVKLVSTTVINTKDELDRFIENNSSFEGIMLRKPDTLYKHGRATAKQEQLLKIKPFADAEAVIVGYEPLYRNHNEATTNELGRTSRSTHQDNLVADDLLGALVCEWGEHTFNIGTGFTEQMRIDLWNNKETLIGKLVKFKYQEFGMKDVPRCPVFLTFRDKMDV